MGRRRRGRRGRSANLQVKPPVFKKLDKDLIAALGVTKKPTLDYSWRRGAEVSKIPSLNGEVPVGAVTTKSVMDPLELQKESPEVRDAILAKSRRVAITYNKGAYQYVTDETDPKSLGSRSRR